MSLNKLLSQTNVKMFIHMGDIFIVNDVKYKLADGELHEYS